MNPRVAHVSVRPDMGEDAVKNSSNRLRAAAIPVLLVVIVALAAYLRFYRLSEQGILGVGEGRYVLDALSARSELEVYTGIVRGKLTENGVGAEFQLHDFLAKAHTALAKEHPFAPKPGIACASAMAMMVTDDLIGAYSRVEAICGVPTVIIRSRPV